MPSPTTTTSLARIQTDPVGDAPTATAFFETTAIIDDQTFVSPWTSVNWSIKDTDKSVTLDNLTLTYAQISAFVVAVAYQEKALADAAKAAAAEAAQAALVDAPVEA